MKEKTEGDSGLESRGLDPAEARARRLRRRAVRSEVPSHEGKDKERPSSERRRNRQERRGEHIPGARPREKKKGGNITSIPLQILPPLTKEMPTFLEKQDKEMPQLILGEQRPHNCNCTTKTASTI